MIAQTMSFAAPNLYGAEMQPCKDCIAGTVLKNDAVKQLEEV